MVARINRTDFVRHLAGGVATFHPTIQGLGPRAALLDANADGVLRGHELSALFNALDARDRDGSRNTLAVRGATASLLRAFRRPAPPSPTRGIVHLRQLGFRMYKASRLQVVHSNPRLPNPDPALRQVALQRHQAVVNGTYYAEDSAGRTAVGAVMRRGQLDTSGLDKAARRGGLAIRADGTIRIGRMDGNRRDDIERVFGRVDSFLGGGALLIEHDRPVTNTDLAVRQRFDQFGAGFASQQLRAPAARAVVAMRRGQCYVLSSPPITGLRLQRLLVRAGFETAVVFDGGSGAYTREPGHTLLHGHNVTGLLVTL